MTRETRVAAMEGECCRNLEYINSHTLRRCNVRSSSQEFLKDGSESSNSVITYARAHTQLVEGENNVTARNDYGKGGDGADAIIEVMMAGRVRTSRWRPQGSRQQPRQGSE